MADLSGTAIETARLHLALLAPDDAPRVLAYYARNRAHLERWEPARSEEFYGEDFWRRRLASHRAEAAGERALRLWLTRREEPGGDVVGAVSLTRIERGPFQCAGLGFGIDAALEGRGLAREAVAAICHHAFAALGFHRLEANHLPDNARSARLLASLGFVVEGYARAYLLIGGAWRDHVLTSLTAK